MLKYLQRLGSDSLIYGLSGTITRFITIFLVPLYTRVLTPSDYGVMSLVRNSTVLVAMVASLALDSAAHRFYWDSEDPGDRKSIIASWAWSCLVLSTLAAILFVRFSESLAMKIGTPQAVRSLCLAAWTVPLGVLSVVYMNRLRMERRPRAFSAFAVVSSLISFTLAAVFVLILRRGVEGVFMAQFIASLIVSAFLAAILTEWINPRYFDWSRLKAMLRFALPILPAVVSLWVVDVVDRYFLQVYSTTSEVGLYEIGYSIAAVVALGTTAFQQAWIPFAMSIQNVPNAREIYATTLVAYTWVGCFACVGVSLFAPEALRILTTKAYFEASTVVAYLAFSYFLMGAAYIVSLGSLIGKRSLSFGVAFTLAALINMTLNFWLVPRYGKEGAALATLISYLVIPIHLYYRSQQIYFIPYRFGRAVVIVLFAVLAIAIGQNLSIESLPAEICVKISLLLLFVPLLFALRIVTVGHVKSLSQSLGFKIPAA